MNWEVAGVLAILFIALVLFVTERLRMDVVAMLVVSALALTGLVGPYEALAGFSNPAVVTVWSTFILSAGLKATGFAGLIGQQVLKICGRSEVRIIITIMLVSGFLSAFMSNIGVAALMLPVVMDLARTTRTAPSRLLMPMAYATMLGGITTVIGTPPNLVASNALEAAGKKGFGIFEFSPIGIPALLIGTLFVALVGRKLLPSRLPKDFDDDETGAAGFRYAYGLEESKRFQLNITKGSPFAGMTLAETRLGPLLGFDVDVVKRESQELTVTGEFVLQEGDRLVVQGKVENFESFRKWQAFEMASGAEIAEILAAQKLILVSVTIRKGSKFEGFTVRQSDFRRRFDSLIMTIRDESGIKRGSMSGHLFKAGDRLQIETRKESLEMIAASGEFENIELIAEESIADIFPDTEALLEMAIPEDSHLTGLRLRETGLAEDLGFRILGIARKGGSILFPPADERILVGDRLLVHGKKKSIQLIKGLQSLEVEDHDKVELPMALAQQVWCEAILAPQSSLAGKSLREINFRNRFGLQIEAILRQGQAYRSHLRNMALEFGDAFLISGPREKIEQLAQDENFVVLTRVHPDQGKAPVARFKTALAGGILVAVVALALTGFVPIAVAAIAGSALMIATRCLSIEEAHKAIDWKAVFLIACMIPLGTAMTETGAAALLAQGVVAASKPFGPWGLLIGVFILTNLATGFLPPAAVVLIMASIGISACGEFGVPPQMVVMAVAVATSSCFYSPISHPAHVLVMGPGGYRFGDFFKIGSLLALVVMITVLPAIWWHWKAEVQSIDPALRVNSSAPLKIQQSRDPEISQPLQK